MPDFGANNSLDYEKSLSDFKGEFWAIEQIKTTLLDKKEVHEIIFHDAAMNTIDWLVPAGETAIKGTPHAASF